MAKKQALNPDAPRKQWARFRVNQYEARILAQKAAELDDGVSNYLRLLIGFQAIFRGAPKGNRNRASKKKE